MRSLTGRLAHSPCAARAFVKAASTSAAVPTGIVVSGLPVKTSSIVLAGRALVSSMAARPRRRSKTSADGAGMAYPSRRWSTLPDHRRPRLGPIGVDKHAGVHDPGGVERGLRCTERSRERFGALPVVPRPVITADRVGEGEGAA